MENTTITNIKNVEAVITPPTPHMVGDGFRMHGYIPNIPQLSMQRMNPFVVLDYGSRFYFPPSDSPRGVGVHPHRGFETVTIVYKGSVAHKDSSGGGGVINEGDVQWMTAAKGILHKEYHEENFSKNGGDFHMVQLWVNLPAKYKQENPKYQAILKEDIQTFILPNESGQIDVIAGQYNNVTGPASTFTPVNLFNARIKAGKSANFSFPENYTTALIIIEGNVLVNGTSAPLDHFVLMERNGEDFEISASEDAVVLVMSGEPIREQIAAYGPFVMNTKEEIIQAFEDFNTGKFGYFE